LEGTAYWIRYLSELQMLCKLKGEKVNSLTRTNDLLHTVTTELNSSVTGYGLDGGGSIPTKSRNLFRYYVQTGSEAHLFAYTTDTGDALPEGLKRPGRKAAHSHLEVKNA